LFEIRKSDGQKFGILQLGFWKKIVEPVGAESCCKKDAHVVAWKWCSGFYLLRCNRIRTLDRLWQTLKQQRSFIHEMSCRQGLAKFVEHDFFEAGFVSKRRFINY
jgi:hypothetical protein